MNDFQSQIGEFFSGLAPEEREKLLAGEGVWKKQSLPAGTIIFEEGASSTDLYLILKGKVEIAKKVGKDGRQKVLAILEEGAVFGEGALLSDKPRSASAKTVDEVEILVLSKSDFDGFMKDKPEIAASLLLGLLKVVNQRLQWTNQELVTLYDVAKLIRSTDDDMPKLIAQIAEKLEGVTQAPKGVIMLKNRSTQTYEVSSSWGDSQVDSSELVAIEQEVGETKRWKIDGSRLFLPIRDIHEKCLGFIIMEQEGEWTRGHKKVARTIADQLGMAIEDHQFMELEQGRERLGRQSVQF